MNEYLWDGEVNESKTCIRGLKKKEAISDDDDNDEIPRSYDILLPPAQHD